MNLRSIAKELVRSADPAYLANSSFENYHAEGLNYLCLLRNTRMTVKAYIFTPELKPVDGNWLVWPHNHRYRFAHQTITGRILNERFVLDGDDDHFDIYSFDPDFKRPSRIGRTGLRLTTSTPDDFAMLDPNELHTLRVCTKNAIALQVQYHDERAHTMMVAPVGAKVSCHENRALYHTPSPENVERWLRLVESHL